LEKYKEAVMETENVCELCGEKLEKKKDTALHYCLKCARGEKI